MSLAELGYILVICNIVIFNITWIYTGCNIVLMYYNHGKFAIIKNTHITKNIV
jgi:hypothetical protein